MVAYREQTIEHTEQCFVCEVRTSAMCECCQRPTCDGHVDRKTRFCVECDEAYFSYRRGSVGKGTMTWFFAGMAVFGAGIALSSYMAIPLMVWGIVGFPCVYAVTSARRRRAFLTGYRKNREYLGPANSTGTNVPDIWMGA
jgi:hypothetical protein